MTFDAFRALYLELQPDAFAITIRRAYRRLSGSEAELRKELS